MAAQRRQLTTHRGFPLWLGAPEAFQVIGDDVIEVTVQEIVQKLVATKLISGTKRNAPNKSKNKPKKLLPWNNYESELNLRDLADDIKEDLRYNDSDEDSEIDEDDISSSWQESFKTFKAEPFPFTGTSGPTISSTDPLTLFMSVWDNTIMSLIVEETNRYAEQIAQMQWNQEMPAKLVYTEWRYTSIAELYAMFVWIISNSIKYTQEYITSPKTAMPLPDLDEFLSLERFLALNSCLHFVDNTKLPETDKMLAKMKPIFDHCNKKFPELYQPRQFLDVDNSVLLSKKGSEKSLRMQANHFGVQTHELSEVFTGYVLKFAQNVGRHDELTSKDKAKIVLDLVDEYSNKGNRVVTNRYYSSVHLARMLKSKGFDAICEVRKTRKDLPEIIQQLDDDLEGPRLLISNGKKVRVVSRHCGDLSVVTWSELDMTLLSTYHTAEMKASTRGFNRPAVVLDYSRVKQKVSVKDHDLTDFSMMTQPSERWYIKQFKKLFNISLRNMYVIYKCNMGDKKCLSQVRFRHKLANQLLNFVSEQAV